MKLYLQNIVDTFPFENLPSVWQQFDLSRFSDKKTLFDYQQNALRNALIALYHYYRECNTNKEAFFRLYRNNGFTETLDLKLNDYKKARIFEDFANDYDIQNNTISFQHFINRMSFWMATGSGKTLVIVKLIEILATLMKEKQIPQNDILFLTYREDLIEQFKDHIHEFNSELFRIHLYSLKDYDAIKRSNRLKFGNEIDIFFYRIDLISDEQKDKIIDFRNYENDGQWYLILDEAHKGDREESKRQHFYSILTRKGFLFNFSATFTDDLDYATCVYNFNLARFIEEGYGKHIYISKQNIAALDRGGENLEVEKQKILLKIFLLQTAINLHYNHLQSIQRNLYHKPLLLTLVNSVNTDDSDLELFFKYLEKIATGTVDEALLNSAKKDLIQELGSREATYEFEAQPVNQNIIQTLSEITYQTILASVFNSLNPGNIEVIKIPGNRQELLFKMKTSDRPFALMKIGDISDWMKSKLTGYEIIEKIENESIFRDLNNNPDINILMGSRSFYEGWDSNRPNVILFINIGKGADAKKFVLQAIGKGVRIEPLPNKRKRAFFLYNRKEIGNELFERIKRNRDALESLFVFGTKASNLKEVIETLMHEKSDQVRIGELFEINPEVLDKTLLIPVYRYSERIIAEEKEVVKIPIHPDDFTIAQSYLNYIGDKVAICKFDCNIGVLEKIKKELNNPKSRYFLIDNHTNQVGNPVLLLRHIFDHFTNRTRELETFKTLQDEITHFKRISIRAKELRVLREKIEKIKQVRDKGNFRQQLKKESAKNYSPLDKYTDDAEKLPSTIQKEAEVILGEDEKIKIKYLSNHYYVPVVLAETARVHFIKHIIKSKSEVDFIHELESYLQQADNVFQKYDWWFFSKIDEAFDDVFIPYYQPKTNRMEKFKPDFVFWMQKGNEYTILFVDLKSTEFTDGYRKIDGYSRIFETEKNGQKESIEFSHDGLTVTTRLLLRTRGRLADVPEKYRRYWFVSLEDLAAKLRRPVLKL